MRFRLGFTVSEYDDNMLYIADSQGDLQALCTIHVDDSLLSARRAFREYVISILESKFGRVKRQSLPFVHLEVWHASMGPCRVSRLQLALDLPDAHGPLSYGVCFAVGTCEPKRAQADSSLNGLHLAPLRSTLRLVAVADAGHASKRSKYLYEGKLVL